MEQRLCARLTENSMESDTGHPWAPCHLPAIGHRIPYLIAAKDVEDAHSLLQLVGAHGAPDRQVVRCRVAVV